MPPAASGKATKKAGKAQKASFSISIYKVMVHPDTGISSKVMSIRNSFVNDIFERIAGPTIKWNDTPDHNALLWTCVVFKSEVRIHTLPRTSPDTFASVVRTQSETGLVTKDYTSPVRAVPS
ncbi:hypothetical protein LAZ67_2004917 [Cordylochernes scorpioides]|uniref:Uncharacterized protein n=1 Tax=Cordylochernes scorpioides TaxID=51811 RepID=A0ABY6K4Z4_9ARAC|nr:hypothetical protein LAZ67_2004917 [Cordylochernes scorpioides]